MHVSQSRQSSSLNTNEYSLTWIKFLGQTPAHSPQNEHQSLTIIKFLLTSTVYINISKFIIIFIILVKNRVKLKKKNKINYFTSKTGTSEFLKSLSETEPI